MIKNSITAILLIIAISILLILIFSFLKKNKTLIKEFLRTTKSLNQKIYTLEIIAGFVAIILFAGYLFHRSSVGFAVVSAMLLFIIYFFGIYFVKDYIAGLIVKASETFKLNETISNGKYKGKIVQFSRRYLIIDSKGNKVFIPYSKLLAMENTILNSQDAIQSFSFKTEIQASKKTKNKQEIIQELKSFIISLPWVNHNLMPEIKIANQEDDTHIVSVTIYSFDAKYNIKIQESVNKFLQSLS